ncbi:hypothetical protein ABE65_019400 [Fictibacillus phosphorivorans]|uniref:Uncharacterized protein n=1 Tax=Fictibacillus phosphorivorans TaxID=1221500 RepID=A0A160IQT5_9BACL|nr:hypothetical protein [Fictibacillus phosphorivorans]ANC78848.1 hypothetical protein ABE65_019400 [Fictibacillus phosphorivorans]
MNLFSSITEESFDYLIRDYGFSEPVDTDGSWKTTFLYVNDQLEIEIELNYRDMDTFIYMRRLDHKQKEQSPRMQLEEILNVEPIKSNGDQTTIEQFEKGITNKAKLLENNLNQIISKTEKIFS